MTNQLQSQQGDSYGVFHLNFNIKQCICCA